MVDPLYMLLHPNARENVSYIPTLLIFSSKKQPPRYIRHANRIKYSVRFDVLIYKYASVGYKFIMTQTTLYLIHEEK